MSNEDWSMGFTYTNMPSSFYRVAIKALITNAAGDLLLTKTAKHQWEVPGGGWEYNESFEQCVRREIQEELGVAVANIGAIQFAVNPRNLGDVMTIRIAAQVTLSSTDFKPADGMVDAKFIDEIDDDLLIMELSDAEVVARFYSDTTLQYN